MSVTKRQVANDIMSADDYMRIPVQKTRCQTFGDCIYNPEEGTVLGKTGKQWGVTGLFYAVFYIVLAIFCYICYKGLQATLSHKRPTWILDESLIGSSPGMGFRPMNLNVHRGSLIWYNSSNDTQKLNWIERIDNFLGDYTNSSKVWNAKDNPTKSGEGNEVMCNYRQHVLKKDQYCAVEIADEDWGPCISAKGYGYNNSTPCVFLKLNKIFGWKPDFYNNKTDLSSDMPASLIKHIQSIQDPVYLDTVWVSCEGERSADREILGDVEYYPKVNNMSLQGFPGYYYPYENTPGYMSPLVAAHFLRPKRNVTIGVSCRAWAKNIKYNRRDKLGMVYFELLIDE